MRSSSRILAIIGLALATVACGDDSPSKTTSAPTPAPTTASTAGTASSTTAVTPLSAEQLHALVLDVADVGAGWRLGPDLNEADFTDSQQLPCPDAALNPTIMQRLLPLTGVQFEPSDGSYKHLIEFMISGEPQRLGTDLQAAVEAMDACATSTATSTASSSGGTLAIERLTIPDLGDQSAAYAMRGTEAAGSASTWYVRSALVRVGGVAVQIGLTEILDTPQAAPTITDATFVSIVQAAVAHLPA